MRKMYQYQNIPNNINEEIDNSVRSNRTEKIYLRV